MYANDTGDEANELLREQNVAHAVTGSILGHGRFYPLSVFSRLVERNRHFPTMGYGRNIGKKVSLKKFCQPSCRTGATDLASPSQ